MSMIVVAVGFSRSVDRVIRRAVLQAKSMEADLFLIHVAPDPEPHASHSEMSASQGAELADLARTITEQDGVACESQLRTGNVADQIVLAAEERAATLILVGPHERGLRDLVASSTVEAISQRARIPILIASSLPLGPYRHILVGTRLDAPSAGLACWLAGDPLGGSAELSILFVHDPAGGPALAGATGRQPGTASGDDELRSARRALDDFLAQNGLAGHFYPQVRLLRAPISFELDELASEIACDLLAIAGSQKALLERVVTGSVAKEVLRELDRDILLYPPSGFGTSVGSK